MVSTNSPTWLQVGTPTLDRPFGLALWPIFEKGFAAIMGYKPQDFRFVPGETPMSTLPVTAITLITYYIIIFGGREVMRNQPALKLNGLFKSHNLGLTIVSFVLLVLFLEQLIPTVVRHGVFHAICSHAGGWTDKLVILYYVSLLVVPIMRCILTPYLSAAELYHQIPRALRHCVPIPQEETTHLSAHLPSRCHRPPLLLPAHRQHFRFLGSYHPELAGACRHVLVLLSICSRCQDMVETVHHHPTDRTIHH